MRSSWLEIDLDALRFNVEYIRSFMKPETKMLIAVKGNAYGHGAVRCSKLFEEMGVEYLGVAIPEEGVELRRAGIKLPILIFGYTFDDSYDLLFDYDLVPNVFTMEQAAQLNALAAEKGYSLYILGAAEGVADKAAEKLIQTYPGLKIAGTYAPGYGFEKNKKEVAAVIQRIRQAQPDILAVSLGSPKGELFIHQHRFDMNVPVAMQIGASVDFIAGNVKRAPRWMSSCGLEWLYRTIQEPKRLAGRYFNDARKILPIIKKYKRGGKP